MLRAVRVTDGTSFYDNLTDFEVVPKLAINDVNLIIKLKNPENLLNKIGQVERYRVSYFFLLAFIFYLNFVVIFFYCSKNKLIAKDNGINGKVVNVELNINVEVINKYAPRFEKQAYYFYVDENAPFNTTVGYLNAVDNDTYANFGSISYKMRNGQERFQIEKKTGRIYTISSNPQQQLDRELIDTYYLSIDAMDGGGSQTSVQAIIKLNDLNDNVPQFLSNLFNLATRTSTIGFIDDDHQNNALKSSFISGDNILIGFIEENSREWIEPIKLIAYDRDIGLNGQFKFEIVDGDYLVDYFAIDPSTSQIVLIANRTMDFEEIFKLKALYASRKNENRGGKKGVRQLENIPMDKFALSAGEIEINLVVRVHDLGQPSLSSKIIAKIIVKV